ncbi:MAG TPA: malto-oligosyltrehalose trehalohydrolase [Vicinamibacterales bacterium]|nr:malto-oligosyltrehalose trehalohydrolase [Vicinamibacterales bacterium]
MKRRLTVGAELQEGRGAHVRVWAPACRRLDLVIPTADARAERVLAMEPDEDGHFEVFDREARPGGRYWVRLDGDRLRPDPASRCQPEGPHQPSAYVDPFAFKWSDGSRKGLSSIGQVLYEMHVGTFTAEGTWTAAALELPELARIGITTIEMMPIADFPGRFGWGYDGVDLYAPAHVYGTPDDLRAFVDRAHALGVAVILDVVYNHLGPDGNYLADFSADYFTDKYTNDWGRAINFEGPAPAREYFVQNARYWIEEFHLDGLRLDATQDIKDASPRHVIADVVASARAAAGDVPIYIIAENEPQQTVLVRAADRGGYGVDALWNDDAHHTAVVALTGRREAYYRDYQGSAQELISCARFGYLYQGQWYSWQKKRRGAPALDLPPHCFVTYLENHDQIANSAFGRRLHQSASPGSYRALTAWLLLGPGTPMLFQGQEYASSRPFVYFADHNPELASAVRRGRIEFLSQFPSLTDDRVVRLLPAPSDEQTFRASKLDHGEREKHRQAYALHCDLLALRRSDAVLSRAGAIRPEGAVLGPGALLLRYVDGDHGDRLLIVNVDCDLDFTPAREPLLAPPANTRWRTTWSSEAPKYGGQGMPPLDPDGPWLIPGGTAMFLMPEQR